MDTPAASGYDHVPIASDRLLDDLQTIPSPWRVERHPTGFVPLDAVLDGGLAPEELVIIGGRPGIGKTVAGLQWASATAASGRPAAYVSYEHSPASLLGRLLLCEAAAMYPERLHEVEKLDAAVRAVVAGLVDLDEVVVDNPLLAPVIDRVRAYGRNLVLVGGSGSETDLDALGRVAEENLALGGVLVVDYLQKVPVRGGSSTPAQVEAHVVEGLKELALEARCTVVAMAASDQDGLAARRIAVHNFRGSTAIAYEADVIVLLEEKMRAVSRVHAAYDLTRTPSFRERVVFSVVKNRSGRSGVDLEFRKQFSCYRFDPVGDFVGENLVDGLLYNE
jgi:replicative DNA helicase